jgi:hypothetical protein
MELKLAEKLRKSEKLYDASIKKNSNSMGRRAEYCRLAKLCTLSFCQGTNSDGQLTV